MLVLVVNDFVVHSRSSQKLWGKRLWGLFLFWLRADFYGLNLNLVLFASSFHFAHSIEAFAACFEFFLVKDEILFVSV